MINQEIIMQLVTDERQRLARETRHDGDDLIIEASRFKRVLENSGITEISTPQELFELCDHLGANLEPSPEMQEVVDQTRSHIGAQILGLLAHQQGVGLQVGQTKELMEVHRQRDLSIHVWRLIQLIKTENPDTFGPKWIQLNNSEIYRDLLRVIRTTKTGINDWEEVKNMLPASIQDRFVLDKTAQASESLVEAIREYKPIADKLGPESLAEFLIAIGKSRHRFPSLLQIISQYLGRCNTTTVNFDDLPGLPDALLRLPGPRKLVFLQLRNHIYRELKDDWHETADSSLHETSLDTVEAFARSKLDDSRQTHLELLNDVIAYWRDVLTIETPDRMPNRIPNKDGKEFPLPSLRQRIAMKEMKEGRRRMAAFFMGQGKTAAAFLSKEHVGAKKMLYICPTHLVGDIRDKHIPKYYKDGEAPTVGTIESGMTGEQITEALEQEVVVLPYSMFGAQRDGQEVTEMVKAAGFDMVTVDEAHNARKPKGLLTETVFDFVNNIPGLYEEGYVLELTGEPVPNTPDDIIPHLRIHDREAFANVNSVKAYLRSEGADPLLLRAAIMDYMILVDEPENWEQYNRIDRFDLYPEERRIYQAIWSDELLDFNKKQTLLSLALINPNLFSSEKVESHFLDRCVADTKRHLETYNCVVIGENSYKEGVTQRHPNYPEALSFAEQLAAAFEGEAEVHVIDGNTPRKQRVAILKASKKTDGPKMIILAMSQTIREGLDLSHVHRSGLVEPGFNQPDDAQWIKRFQRENNTDVENTTYVPFDSLFEGILRHASQKAVLCHRFKHGGTITEEDIAHFEVSDLSDEIRIYDGQIWIGSPIMEHMLTPAQKLARILAYLHGRNPVQYEHFINLFGEKFVELYMANWPSSPSANNGRFVAGLFEQLEADGFIKGIEYGDIAAGPLALENTLGIHPRQDGLRRNIRSTEKNPHMLEAGKKLLHIQTGDPTLEPNMSVCGMDNMRDEIADGQLNAVNFAYALHHSHLNTRLTTNTHKDHRVQTLCELNRILKTGGVAIITLPLIYNTEELLVLQAELSHFGFDVLPQYTGVGRSTDEDQNADTTFENYTITCRKIGTPNLEKVDLKNLKLSRVKREAPVTPKPGQQKTDRREIPSMIHTEFELGKLPLSYKNGTDPDKKIELEYQTSMDKARAFLLDLYAKRDHTLENLTAEEVATLRANGGIKLIKLGINRQVDQWIFTLEKWPDRPELVFPN